MPALVTQSLAAPLADRKNDLYETHPVAVRALLAHEEIPQVVWEPACGPGAIVRELRAAGRTVVASDLVDYGCAESTAGWDFLMERTVPPRCECIVTNPPFKLASRFVDHALYDLRVPKVCMLLRLAFLESEGRRTILDGGHLARVFVFRNRLPMMHRDGWDGERIKTGAVAFAWFVWDRSHVGSTHLHRISWSP